jgi:isoamylase
METMMYPGKPYPLGATWDGKGVNFALYAEHATKVELCLFDGASGQLETCRYAFYEKSHQI